MVDWHEFPAYDVKNTSELVSRCDVCKESFRVIMVDGRLVDPDDKKRHVSLGQGRYVHARCETMALKPKDDSHKSMPCKMPIHDEED